VRSHVESKDQHNSRYPYEEAKSTIDYIKSLGIEDKLTFVDKFRIVITEIGNAIGYVRMIRSGGLLFTSNSIRFVPDLNNIRKVDELIQGEENVFSQDTLTCSKYLDDIIENLYRNFTEGTNYFAMLVEIFKKQYKNEKNVHLDNFYVIVPALTINFIEHLKTCKEKFHKKGKEEGTFTDDGFIIGIAFLLKVLDQNIDFDSLRWFESVKEYYHEQKKLMTSKSKDKQMMTAIYSMSKVDALEEEFNLLKFSFLSARVFFQ